MGGGDQKPDIAGKNLSTKPTPRLRDAGLTGWVLPREAGIPRDKRGMIRGTAEGNRGPLNSSNKGTHS